MKKIIYYIILLTTILSCEETVENFKIEEKPSKLVINALFGSDSTIKLHISKSLSLYDKDSIYIVNNANIEVIENNTSAHTLNYLEDGWYTSTSLFLKEGAQYQVNASAPGFEDITSIIKMPQKPEIISIDTGLIQINSPDCMGCMPNNYIELKVKFKDAAESDDYYMLNAKTWIKNYEGKEVQVYDQQYDYYYYDWIITDSSLSLNDIFIQSDANFVELVKDYSYYYFASQDYTTSGDALFFSDNLFNGDEVSLTLLFNIYDFTADTAEEIYFYLSKITEEHYYYINSLAKAGDVDGNPIAEKVTIYNNIENGLGHIMGFSTELRKVDITGLRDEIIPDWTKY